MLEDRNPNLKCVVAVLATNLVQGETIVHRLLHKADILVITDFKPIVHLLLDPATTPQNIESHLRPHETSYKRIPLPDEVRVNVTVGFVQ